MEQSEPRSGSKADSDHPNGGFSRKAFTLLVLVGVSVALIIAAAYYFQSRSPVILNWLFIDLEYGLPDQERHKELTEAFSKVLMEPISERLRPEIHRRYVHFTELSEIVAQSVDFIVLSPQGTPWYMYQGDVAHKLNIAKAFVKEQILVGNIPTIGICGGHQFLVMAFGGTVDFIDPKFVGTFPKRYPKEAISERGVVELHTLAADPIFENITFHPGKFRVVQNHYEEVKSVPSPFVNIARSNLSENQLIRIPGKIAYGTAFHPERGWNGDRGVLEGKRLMSNFIKMVLANRRQK